MANYSVADAKNQLSSLIDRANQGDEVVITRHGKPVAILQPAARVATPMTPEDVAWLREHRVGKPAAEDAGSLVSRMRDEDWR